MKPLDIAIAAHTINAAYCLSLGDESQVPWDGATKEHQKSLIQGVEFVIANPNAGPDAQHNAWLKEKEESGWVYGETKDEEAKTHPCMVPFDELPQEQKSKDYLFKAAVEAVLALPKPEPVVEDKPKGKAKKAEATDSPVGFTPIRYIGKRQEYVENLYGTGIKFTKGEVELVPNLKAPFLLKHPDQYEVADAKDAVKEPQPAPKAKDKDTDESLQQARDLVANMPMKAVREFVKTNFNQSIKVGTNTEDGRKLAIQLIDQYGLV